MKLNLSPRIFSFDSLFVIRQSTRDFNPLSLILLWPISKNYSLGWFLTIFSEMALAPSYPILLLKMFRYFNDLLLARELASSKAPETPIKFLLKSKTSRILLWGRIYVKAFNPSFPKLFLERSSTLILLLNSALLGSRAKTRASAMFLLRWAWDKETFSRLGLLANSWTN